MPFATDHENKILEVLFGQRREWSMGEDVYLALCSNDPRADDGVFNELSGDTYERVWISVYANSTLSQAINYMSTPEEGSIQNQRQINWNKATVDWGTAQGFGIFSVKTGGEIVFYDRLKEPVEIKANCVALFDPGDFKISFKDPDDETEAAMTTT